MKKTVSVNLSGILFNIDDDAYNILEDYLNRIESHFSGQGESKEIMADIESRIAELLNERHNGAKKVVSVTDIEAIIKTMGNPDDFIEPGNGDSRSTQYTARSRGHKRIYRDPDNRVLGGVCAGLGAYFNIDPVIFRIIIVILTPFGGAGLLIYIVLWIIIPDAVTTAQKLEMRGDPVNVSNIGNFIKEEFESVKNSFSGKKRPKK
ncbi:MAG: PspC domain-containing protein [Bacteroidales bacterium]|nr:PspC domain-containing protein [Bacteroidales bacterium]